MGAADHPHGGREHGGESANPGPVSTVVIVLACVLLGMLILYSLWVFWPTNADLKPRKQTPTVSFFGTTHSVSTDLRLFVIVALAGALGALMHSMRSLAWYVGHGMLKWRWIPYYVITLLLGAGLATIIYIVVRGGLFASTSGDKSVNPYGFGAVAALTGLFTEQALEMLRKVATDFFAPAPPGTDRIRTSETDASADEPEDEFAPEARSAPPDDDGASHS